MEGRSKMDNIFQYIKGAKGNKVKGRSRSKWLEEVKKQSRPLELPRKKEIQEYI